MTRVVIWTPITRTARGRLIGPWLAPRTGLTDGLWVTRDEAHAIAAEHDLDFIAHDDVPVDDDPTVT